ncbi:hypothetical protein PRZ48_013787 [Zasmidium cellare]|uniref:ABC transmembrane type-1 domain-containing protein n=1 Tax=Zasmidium cellare TaxID=395010 RepID=A0ABR0E2K6_ZASCE|nr:hypothetical protein PRZ48_013787 [Zasmidium cellare]
MASSIPAALIAVKLTQTFYLRASKELRLLDLEARSAVGASFLEAPPALLTLRTFAHQPTFSTSASTALEASQRPLFLLLCVQRWLQIVLDLFIAALNIGVVLLVTQTDVFREGAQIGIVLNVLIAAQATLLRFVRAWTAMEVAFGGGGGGG